jgi:hypothetical protein
MVFRVALRNMAEGGKVVTVKVVMKMMRSGGRKGQEGRRAMLNGINLKPNDGYWPVRITREIPASTDTGKVALALVGSMFTD